MCWSELSFLLLILTQNPTKAPQPALEIGAIAGFWRFSSPPQLGDTVVIRKTVSIGWSRR
jgi:hypothetical protein